MFGKHPSEEKKKKQSEKKKGKNNPMFGKHHSEKTKKLMEKNHADGKGENNPQSILKEKDVIKIWEYLNDGELTQIEIGKIFKVKHQTVSDIKREKSWKYIINMK